METRISEISYSQVNTDNQTTAAGTTKTTPSARGPNFTEEECCMLAQAYLHRSTNAAVGTNQPNETFWETVHHNYCLLVNQANN